MIDKYGRSKDNFDKPKGYGKGGMIKGFMDGGSVKRKSNKAVVDSANRISKMEAESAKKMKEMKNAKKKKGKKKY